MILLQAHRGAKQHYPENTLPAFYGAIKEGYSFIELDPRFTKDNKCIIIHDPFIGRTGRNKDGSKIEGQTEVCLLTLDEIRSYDFGIYYGEEFKGTTVPTLEEVLSFVKETKMPLKFDNIIGRFEDKNVDYFLDTIKNSGVEEYIGITAFDVNFVKRVTDRLTKCTVHYDGETSEAIYRELTVAAKGHPLFIWLPNEKKSWLPYPPATKEDVILARKYGKVGLWTAHTPETLKGILALEPDAMELEDKISPADVMKLVK